nr:oligosaccharide flippase family protein [Sporocytophaga myxococcoides]
MGLSVFLNILIKPIWIILENLVQNKIGHEDYGLYSALFSFGFIFIILTDFGINYYVTKSIARNSSETASLFSQVTLFKVLLTVLFPIACTFLGYLWGYKDEQLIFLFFLSFTNSLLQLVLYGKAILQGKQEFYLDSYLGILDKFLLALFTFFLIIFSEISLESFIAVRLLTAILTVGMGYYFLKKVIGFLHLTFNWKQIKDIIISSLPFASMAVLYSVNDKIDQVLLERLLGKTPTGLYAAAYRWLDATMMYIWIIMPIFFARFPFYKEDKQQVQKLFNAAQLIAAIPVILAASFVFFYPEVLVYFLNNSSESELEVIKELLRILFVSLLLNGFFNIYSTYLNAMGYVKIVNISILISVFLNILLNFMIVPTYGVIASAWITVISTFILCVFAFVYIGTKTIINVPWKLLFKLSMLLIILLIMFAICRNYDLNWILAGILSIIITVLYSLVSGFKQTLKEYK